MAENLEQLLTVREVAHTLRVDETTVRRWVKNGILPAIELPHGNNRTGYRIKRAALDHILNPLQAASVT